MPDVPFLPLLRVRTLDVTLASRRVLSGVSFEIEPGAAVGLFGESGCGKTTLALSLLNLLSPERYQLSGSIEFEGKDLLHSSQREMRQVRGAGMAMIPQDPLLALNPVMRAGDQVAEAIRAHSDRTVNPIREQADAALRLAGLEPTARIQRAFPHQLSGGERQRVLIAQALACKPRLVIADEPFSALDAPSALALAALFRELRQRLSTSFLLISHSRGVLAHVTDRVLVMNAGRIVKQGAPREVLPTL